MLTLLLDSEAECADDLFMFVRCKKRRKDGKEHRYWSVVETVRVRSGRVVQRCCIWGRSTTASVRRGAARSRLWKASRVRGRWRCFPRGGKWRRWSVQVVRVQVQNVVVHEPRQWGACWLALCLWDRLELDRGGTACLRADKARDGWTS